MKVCLFVFVLNFHSLKIVCAQALQHVVSHESLLNKHLGHRPKKFGNHCLRRSSTEIKDFPTFFLKTNGNAIFCLEFIALSCSSEVLVLKISVISSVFCDLFFGYTYFDAEPFCRLRKYSD